MTAFLNDYVVLSTIQFSTLDVNFIRQVQLVSVLLCQCRLVSVSVFCHCVHCKVFVLA